MVSQFVVASLCRRDGFQHRWRKDFAKYVGRALLGRRLAFPGSLGFCGLRTASSVWNVPGKYGPHGELLFLIRRSPLLSQGQWCFKPVVPAETPKACFLVGLHLVAAEGDA